MALIVAPDTAWDSFISVQDAESIIIKNSVHSSKWLSLQDSEKEVYLRIATSRILSVISTDSTSPDGYFNESDYDASFSCLPNASAFMAIHDITYELSSSINPNVGLITKEKIGDIEVAYKQSKGKGIVTSPFPSRVAKCLESYGATNLFSYARTMKLIRS